MGVLSDVKQMLAHRGDDTSFDVELIIYINSAFSTLRNLRIGPDPAFKITGDDETWDEFMLDEKDIELVKEYVWARVKLVFDPPTTSATMESLKEIRKELEFRLSTVTDNT